ncbi:MAG: hypothetical protein ABA06_03290 [Parcubacteria bacterium C7867-001]|nr:MAG: hypothetical protein ABA06_03290 [Parcubacteria bacterium C7867-001]
MRPMEYRRGEPLPMQPRKGFTREECMELLRHALYGAIGTFVIGLFLLRWFYLI